MTVAAGVDRNEISVDHRLSEAVAILREEDIEVLSLDVFDTLVWRVVPSPVDAFVLLGHRLRDLGHLVDLTPELFARVRTRAEARARRLARPATSSGEVPLEAIYDQMPEGSLVGLSAAEMAAMEVELERDIVFPDLEVVELARLARHECGARVALVSDTYFSPEQLHRLLDRPPLAELATTIFTSSHHGVGKAGGLYRMVLETLEVPPEKVLHVGDNKDADVVFAAELGIRTVHFPQHVGDMPAILRQEGFVARVGGHPSGLVDPVRGDRGLTALRSKAAFSSTRSELNAGVVPYWNCGAAVLGPVFTGFAEWAHARARAHGVTTVHCVMREGEFLARLLNGARSYLGSPVRAQTIWLSRQTCARAAIFSASAEEISGFLDRRRPPTLSELCDALGINVARLPELSGRGEGRLDDPVVRKAALEAITGRAELRAEIVDASARLRRRLVEHFVTSVGPDTERVVLADLGWAGTIQAYLQAALAGEGVEFDVTGLYLVTHEGAVDRLLEGVRTEGYLAGGGIPENVVRQLMRSPEVLEQVCMADVGSLVDFTPGGEPVTGPVSEPPRQMVQRVTVQQGVLAFQDEWARYRDVVPVQGRSLEDDGIRPLLLRVLSRFVISPTPGEAEVFGRWSHDENFGSEAAETVLAGEMGPMLRYMTPAQFMSLPMQKVYWGYGLASLFRPPLGQAVAAITDGDVPAETFDPSVPRLATVSVHSRRHVALLHAQTSGRLLAPVSSVVSLLTEPPAGNDTAVWSGGEGLCYLREEVQADSIAAVQVDFPAGPGLVRLDRMSLRFGLRGRPEDVPVDVEWPAGHRAVSYSKGRRVAPNVLYGPRRAPRIIYSCPREWGTDAYRVEVELAFAWVPTGPANEVIQQGMEALYRAGVKARRRLTGRWAGAGATAP